MRQKMVWFILGVLVGSLFVVSAYPTGREVQYGVPTVQKIAGNNYTAYILYSKEGLPLDPKVLKNRVQQLVEESAPKAKWHVYAVPELPKGSFITGYGIKVTQEGRVDILITARSATTPTKVKVETLRNELLEWSKKAPKFKPDVIPKGRIGVPRGWEVKTVDSNGNVKVYSGESEPYWHNFGRQELRYDDPPYGKLYAQFFMWGLWNDNNPSTETFACTKDEDGRGTYRATPGILLKNSGNSDYGKYWIRKMKIIHNWRVDPALNGHLGLMGPAGIIDKHSSVTVSVGPISYPLNVGGYKIYGDDADPKAIWTVDTMGTARLYTEASEHTVEVMVSSEGEVKESALHDGKWHPVVNVKLSAELSGNRNILPTDIHNIWTALTWYVKVG
ncbi:MAG: hypothetical protein PWQ79_1206 [Thermococcaceae archaeon]|nr:hypothetical protein [Thermococcaceae archaeon]MDK2914291.1 hypothetical protein [Thermococcaceae archaeon]